MDTFAMDKFEIRRLNVQRIIKAWCGDVIARFAEETGIRESYVSRMLYEPGKNGKKNIGEVQVDKILKAFDLAFGWLDVEHKVLLGRPAGLKFKMFGGYGDHMQGEGSRPSQQAAALKLQAYSVRQYTEEGDLDPEREFLVEEVDVQLSAGGGIAMPEFVETKYKMPFQQAWFRKHHAKPENVRLMRVHGDSMESLVFEGDRVAIHLTDKRIINGRVYGLIYGDDNFGRIKRLYRTKSGGLRIVSDNKSYQDELIEGDDLELVCVIGRVIDKSGSGGL